VNELVRLTASRAAQMIAARELGSLEYCDALIARCEDARDLNAIVDYDWDRLRADAQEADRAPGGRLSGVPIIFKANIDTVELTTSACTGALRNFVAGRNAAVAQALFDEGALLGGKANMHELAFGITNNNPVTGPARNPHDSAMIPGGSSGGVAAAVAAFLMPVGIGTDTGASVRLPAALCGCVGFRPTVGRYKNSGIIPISHTRDTAGPIARSVEDAALIDSVLTGEFSAKPGRPRPVRIGIPRAYFFADLDSELAAVVEQALARIAAAGIELVEADIPDIARLNAAVSAPIARFEFVRDLDSYLKEHDLDLDLHDILEGVGSLDVRRVLTDELGSDATLEATYIRALTQDRPKLQQAYSDYFTENRLDAAIFPTAPLPARPIGHDETVELCGQAVSTFETYIRNTDPASNAGIPALSLPVGMTKSGLPVGLEIDGAAGSDRRLLRVARTLEAAFEMAQS